MKISLEQINVVVSAGLVETNTYSGADELYHAAIDALASETMASFSLAMPGMALRAADDAGRISRGAGS
jgi:hypothetical protein